MVSKGTQNLLVNLGIVVLVIVIIYVVIIRNPNALNWLKGLGKKTGAAVIANTASGWNVYQTTGNTCPVSTNQTEEINACGGPVDSQRAEHNECGYYNIEATAIIQLQANDTCGCGTEFDVKLMGPGHSDGNCCWWLFVVNEDEQGGITTGGEGPHESGGTIKNSKDGVELDSIPNWQDGAKIGIKGITWDNEDGTRHFEGWVDPTGTGNSWQLAAHQDLAEWGHNEKTNQPAFKGGEQQIQFRCDCDNAVWEKSTVEEIVPEQRATGGGTAPPPSAPPPSEEEDEDEDDDGEDEEDEEEDNEEETEGSCDESRCTCANGAFFTVPGCNNDDCTRRCTNNANQAKVLVFTSKRHLRLGNIR